MTKKDKIKKMMKNKDPYLFIGGMKYPKYGQYVFTGLIAGKQNIVKYIGYCVQVRERAGVLGSHQVFLRHCDGSLTVHENQSFCGLTKQQQKIARKIFVMHIKDEKPYKPYTISGKLPEKGFFVPARQEAEQ